MSDEDEAFYFDGNWEASGRVDTDKGRRIKRIVIFRFDVMCFKEAVKGLKRKKIVEQIKGASEKNERKK